MFINLQSQERLGHLLDNNLIKPNSIIREPKKKESYCNITAIKSKAVQSCLICSAVSEAVVHTPVNKYLGTWQNLPVETWAV